MENLSLDSKFPV